MLRSLTSGAVVMLAAVATQPALACSDLPNICAAQAQHHQQMVDIAATAPQGEQGSASTSSPPRPDPMQVRMGVAIGMIQMMQRQVDNAVKLATLRKDPRNDARPPWLSGNPSWHSARRFPDQCVNQRRVRIRLTAPPAGPLACICARELWSGHIPGSGETTK